MTVDALRAHGYDDIQVVGAGGLGDVYRARRVSTGGHVAIKVVREQVDREATDRRVRRELEALLKLKGHPNVVQIEELITLPTGLALVMEFVSGGSLMEFIKSNGPLDPAQAVAAMADITRALADAHSRGIVHRDIKPHNVMVGEFGQCKVCDFGIAAVFKDTAYTDRTSALSYRYASPEELDDAPEIGPATDVYSLGVTLRQLLTGETSEARALAAVTTANDAGNLSLALSGTLRALMELTARMTARIASDRPTSVGVLGFIRDLERALGAERRASVIRTAVAEATDDTNPTVIKPSRVVPLAPAEDHTIVRPRHAPPPAAPPRALPNPISTPEKWWV